MTLSTSIRTAKPLIRKCAYCKQEFEKKRMGQKVCGQACSIGLIADQRKKRERKEDQERKEALKTLSDHLKEAQAIFNAFIRERDKYLPCISCGEYRNTYDAGHYRSTRAAPELRFHEDNVHKQCVLCNQFRSGNAIEYRLRLVQKIGVDRVEWLEGPHDPAKYQIEDAKQIKATYKAKLKALKETE